MNKVIWHKSSYSPNTDPNCVECRAPGPDRMLLRDSQHPELGHLDLPSHEWTALLHAVRTGEV
ncbi:DUF397 domain-containing protein [Lipingzhangella sp. LS1_29]|uniref:DUF397 domain-containing protein n=1 Tax=Lipingzhangella rawalii TaxID=2055835 RepID=A0ABU2H9T0_9ACTN|nr:DUF397 domain-containing protein [Lipingzhangella rawalii]MDS1271614.1 DUF397 domain-containing protein [Lipingzhangella rawalii]